MSTPSKEALEAAEAFWNLNEKFFSKQAFMKSVSAIIDRHFEPLRQRAEQAEARVKELQKQEAESRRLFYSEQDKRQSAEYRCEELAGALRNAAKFARSMEQLAYGGIEEIDDEECVSIACRAEDALARHAVGDPEAQK